MMLRALLIALSLLPFAALAGSAAEPPKSASIRRLDGTTITTAQAEAFARKTLDESHVTGAQIAVLDRGRLVWSEAFGLRRIDPKAADG